MIHAVARSAHAVTDGQERRDALGELLELTSAMLEAALSGEWERLVALEATRQERIHEFFSTPRGRRRPPRSPGPSGSSSTPIVR